MRRGRTPNRSIAQCATHDTSIGAAGGERPLWVSVVAFGLPVLDTITAGTVGAKR